MADQTLPSVSTLADSRMSINGLLSPPEPSRDAMAPNRIDLNEDMNLDGHDEAALRAAETLGSMALGHSPAPPAASSSSSNTPTSPTSSSPAPLLSRVSNLAFVMYEQSKANNRIINYAGGVVENSVKALISSASKDATTPASASTSTSTSIAPPTSQLTHRNRARSSSRSSSPHRHTLNSPTGAFHPYPPNVQTLTTKSSRWQQLMREATTTAGSTVAVVSEESMKCLRYCLSWLQYAVQHIDQQILILRDFLLSLGFSPSSSNSQQLAIPSSASQTLSQIKKEVIETLRKVVEVVSRYAGATLPEQARKSVRVFILSLPGRFASLNESRTGAPSSPMSSPMLSPTYSSPSTPTTPTFPRDAKAQPTAAHMHESGVKILNLAVESVDMLKSVSTIFSDTIERAESWLERLKYVGVGGLGGDSPAARDLSSFEGPTLPPINRPRPSHKHFKSKSSSPNRSSASSDNEDMESDEEVNKRMPMIKKKKKAQHKKAERPAIPDDSGVDGDGMGAENMEL